MSLSTSRLFRFPLLWSIYDSVIPALGSQHYSTLLYEARAELSRHELPKQSSSLDIFAAFHSDGLLSKFIARGGSVHVFFFCFSSLSLSFDSHTSTLSVVYCRSDRPDSLDGGGRPAASLTPKRRQIRDISWRRYLAYRSAAPIHTSTICYDSGAIFIT